MSCQESLIFPYYLYLFISFLNFCAIWENLKIFPKKIKHEFYSNISKTQNLEFNKL